MAQDLWEKIIIIIIKFYLKKKKPTLKSSWAFILFIFLVWIYKLGLPLSLSLSLKLFSYLNEFNHFSFLPILKRKGLSLLFHPINKQILRRKTIFLSLSFFFFSLSPFLSPFILLNRVKIWVMPFLFFF